jgi:hypothetical protein
MTWQHPCVVIDQNQLRNPDVIKQLLDECRRAGLRLMLPDGAFLEFSKSGYPFDTARRSLQILAPYPEFVCSSRKLADLLRTELQSREPCATLVEETATAFLRSMLAKLEHGDESTLRKLVDGPLAEMMPPALEVWNNHEENKRLIQGIHDQLKADMSSDQLKALRRSPENAPSDWLSSLRGIQFVFQGLVTV